MLGLGAYLVLQNELTPGAIILMGRALAPIELAIGQWGLVQRVQLFDGTIANNIARLDPNADPEKIVAAAKKAAAHDMILKLPEGYDTVVTTTGGRLSGGQI